MTYVTRFAPSPTGLLHLGHAYSALVAHDRAHAHGGRFLLRMDDIDSDRCKPVYEQRAIDDLAWLGLTWDGPIWRQSQSLPAFDAALATLGDKGLLYPCACSRRDIDLAAGAPQEGAPTHGPDGRIYPGTCRGRSLAERGPTDALRLDMAKALTHVPRPIRFCETGPLYGGPHELDPTTLREAVGDVVLSRRSGGPAYHLAVVIDDHAQGITEVTRGADLFDATQIHVLLQHLLELPVPDYHHHDLIRDETGKRLAKRDDARALATYRAAGQTPDDIRRLVGLSS
ncbi:MAG: tRNA glutamyl-Q(34) synthetase GluQRS [Pseudomonadota bacterium]